MDLIATNKTVYDFKVELSSFGFSNCFYTVLTLITRNNINYWIDQF